MKYTEKEVVELFKDYQKHYEDNFSPIGFLKEKGLIKEEPKEIVVDGITYVEK